MQLPSIDRVISILETQLGDRRSRRKIMNYAALVLAITAIVPVTMAIAVLYTGSNPSLEGVGWLLVPIARSIQHLSAPQILLAILLSSSALMFAASLVALRVPKRKVHRLND